MTQAAAHARETWPALPYAAWKDTQYALHRWTQVVGKIRLALTPLLNHWWNSTLYVTPRGLTTASVPSGDGAFQIDLDLVQHELVILTSHGERATFRLGSMSVASFYHRVIEELARCGVPDPQINTLPSEVATAIPFPEDADVRPYDRGQVERFHAILLCTAVVFERFRSGFLGKQSPVQFFWGSFDLGVARFSGRRAPVYTGTSGPHVHIHVMHEAYSHEVIEAGLWMGSDDVAAPEFYSFPIPPPAGLADAAIRPDAARWDAARGEFVLSYDAVRAASDPEGTLLEFLQSTYDVGADLGHWDRPLLEERPACGCELLPPPRRMVVTHR